MDADDEYQVELWEDDIERDETGRVVHHPLNSRYFVRMNEDTVSYGYLSFAGHHLDKSPILNDIKVFYLEFKGLSDETYEKEEWADPLRIEVLNRLTGIDRCWYMSMIDRWFRGVNDDVAKLVGTQLNRIIILSEKPFGNTYGFRFRELYEIPNRYLQKTVPYFWEEAVPGYPIEGYNMDAGQIALLKQWDARSRDDQLFREVIDRTFINFYTFPDENRFFVFVTNKLNYDELAKLIRLDELQEKAREIGRKTILSKDQTVD